MDARLDVEEALGLRTGDAHVIRNAGGLATDDAIRSLIVSQQLLGTDEIVVIGHTGCGLLGADEDALRDRLAAATGRRLALEFGSFADLEQTVRVQVERSGRTPGCAACRSTGWSSRSRPAASSRSAERRQRRGFSTTV